MAGPLFIDISTVGSEFPLCSGQDVESSILMELANDNHFFISVNYSGHTVTAISDPDGPPGQQAVEVTMNVQFLPIASLDVFLTPFLEAALSSCFPNHSVLSPVTAQFIDPASANVLGNIDIPENFSSIDALTQWLDMNFGPENGGRLPQVKDIQVKELLVVKDCKGGRIVDIEATVTKMSGQN